MEPDSEEPWSAVRRGYISESHLYALEWVDFVCEGPQYDRHGLVIDVLTDSVQIGYMPMYRINTPVGSY